MQIKPDKKRASTMNDVAERAGVSIQTVSAVVNEKPGISRATTESVLSAIKDLHYRPFHPARRLRTRQTKTIALFVSDISASPLGAMVNAIENQAYLRGYNLAVYNTHNDLERERSYIITAIDNWVDGVIIVVIDELKTSIEAFSDAGIPVVAVDRTPENIEVCSVSLDNLAVGKMAADYLLSLGHRSLGVISGPLRLSIARDSKTAFVESCLQAGAHVLEGDYEGDWHTRSGYTAMLRLLAQQDLPTAVFVASDLMAIGALRAIQEKGWSVPDDMSVVGVDNIETAEFSCPPLTTIRQPFDSIGKAAINLLLDLLGGKPIAEGKVLIEPSLIIRQSTAGPSTRR
ncbi:MAG: LacI family DNA-binding transcriptional regulator [Anaerolineae bacterium]